MKTVRYYFLRSGITKVAFDENWSWSKERIDVWFENEHAGTLFLPKRRGWSVCMCFAAPSEPAIVTHYDGVGKGYVIEEKYPNLDPSIVLMSEYGKPITVAEVRKLAEAH